MGGGNDAGVWRREVSRARKAPPALDYELGLEEAKCRITDPSAADRTGGEGLPRDFHDPRAMCAPIVTQVLTRERRAGRVPSAMPDLTRHRPGPRQTSS